MLLRNADFNCHAAPRGAPTTARGRVRCAVAIFSVLLVYSALTQILKFWRGAVATQLSNIVVIC